MQENVREKVQPLNAAKSPISIRHVSSTTHEYFSSWSSLTLDLGARWRSSTTAAPILQKIKEPLITQLHNQSCFWNIRGQKHFEPIVYITGIGIEAGIRYWLSGIPTVSLSSHFKHHHHPKRTPPPLLGENLHSCTDYQKIEVGIGFKMAARGSSLLCTFFVFSSYAQVTATPSTAASGNNWNRAFSQTHNIPPEIVRPPGASDSAGAGLVIFLLQGRDNNQERLSWNH